MTFVCIDPFLLACPQPSINLEPFEVYIINLVRWAELCELDWITVTISSQGIEILFEAADYPIWESVDSGMRTLGITHIQLGDVKRVIDGLLQKVPCLEELLGIDDLLFDCVECAPSADLAARPARYIEHLHYLLGIMGFTSSLYSTPPQHKVIITRDIFATKIRVKGEVLECEFSDSAQHAPCILPFPIDVELPVCYSPENLLRVIDYVEVWRHADTEAVYRKAIEIYIFQRFPNTDKHALESLASVYRFGTSFFETADRFGFLRDSSKIECLLRAIAETILGENPRDTHGLRINPTGGAPQRKRGSYRAWRRDIDYQYHLHYWKESSGIEFELASIVVHDDATIPE